MINVYFDSIKNTLDKMDKQQIYLVTYFIRNCFGNIYIFGNGGSAATASHFAQDLNKMADKRCICLNDNIPSILAYGNDVGFESIFKLQLSKLIQDGDIVIGISCSGNSRNVTDAIAYAKERGCNTIGFMGFDGGILKSLVDYFIHVPLDDMQVCEDIHLIITHTILKLLKFDLPTWKDNKK